MSMVLVLHFDKFPFAQRSFFHCHQNPDCTLHCGVNSLCHNGPPSCKFCKQVFNRLRKTKSFITTPWFSVLFELLGIVSIPSIRTIREAKLRWGFIPSTEQTISYLIKYDFMNPGQKKNLKLFIH